MASVAKRVDSVNWTKESMASEKMKVAEREPVEANGRRTRVYIRSPCRLECRWIHDLKPN
jgi:hypothetical protein